MKYFASIFGLGAILLQSCTSSPKNNNQQKYDDSIKVELSKEDSVKNKKDNIEALMLKLSSVCNGQSISGTKPSLQVNDIHKLIFIGDDAESWNWDLPDSLLPTQLSEVEYVGCIKETEKVIDSTEYATTKGPLYLKRIQKQKIISIYNASNGKLFKSKSFLSEPPKGYPFKTESFNNFYGPDITYTDIKFWLFTEITNYPIIEINTINKISPVSALFSINVIFEGVSNLECGICWADKPAPTIYHNKTSYGKGHGSFTSELLNLEENKTYYVRAYLKNKTGTFYSNELNFIAEQTFGTFIDERDKHKYQWIKIGKQVWMAENLAFKPINGNFWAYDNNIKFVEKYGYLYDWETAKEVCPTGWHLPSEVEWYQLLYSLKIIQSEGNKKKATAIWKYDAKGKATNGSGFNALPAGSRICPSYGDNVDHCLFHQIGDYASFWYNSSLRYIEFRYDNGEFQFFYGGDGLSVRCVKD